MKLKSPYLIKPGASVNLSRFSTSYSEAFRSQEAAAPVFVSHCEKLSGLQEILYASQQKALLIVLQGMDTAGKDGTIRSIFSGVNPQGCNVSSFKVPTPFEARHDFLWRVHSQVPPRGMIQIFNRSHYEDVIVPHVHKLLPQNTIDKRLDDINEFESMLSDNGVVILKFFLHISRAEQTRRLKSRIDDPKKHWKLSEADFRERRFWPRYEKAYTEILSATSKRNAPWFVIPSDYKWYRNIAVSKIILDAMEALKLKYPKPTLDPTKIRL